MHEHHDHTHNPMPDGPETTLSPDQAVDRLEVLHAEAMQAHRAVLARFAAGGPPPDAEERHRVGIGNETFVTKESANVE